MKGSKKIVLLLLVFVLSAMSVEAQKFFEGKYYPSAKGEPIYMPLGTISFADKVVSFEKGDPIPLEEFLNPEEALGEPNYTHYREPNYLSLGCGGVVVLEFSDNGFIDMDGPDLFLWEVGPSKEPYNLEISTDGKQWRNLGVMDGGKEEVDISRVVDSDAEDVEIFYFVRITDLKTICTGDTIGSDIDAVGTISGVIKIELSTDVLFDFDKYEIKADAKESILELSDKIAEVGMAEIRIEGHTDSDGTEAYNNILSERRAEAVLQKLETLLTDKGTYIFKTKSYGELRPIATNETEEGRQQNRRVEIVVLPHKDFYKERKK